jgi:hypothetical protein
MIGKWGGALKRGSGSEVKQGTGTASLTSKETTPNIQTQLSNLRSRFRNEMSIAKL